MTHNDFYRGAFAGAFATGITYPFDTIKTRLQRSKTINWNHSLFRGVTNPLTSIMLEKATLFYSFGLIEKTGFQPAGDNVNINNFCYGVTAGITTTFIVTPFERVKILTQTSNGKEKPTKILTRIIKKEGISALGRGWTATLFREVPGYGFYFGTYKFCKSFFGENYNLPLAWFTGGLSGFVPWIFIYPADTIKTTMQDKNMGFIESAKHIRATGGGFYKGYSVGLLRAFFLHSFVILGYEIASGFI